MVSSAEIPGRRTRVSLCLFSKYLPLASVIPSSFPVLSSSFLSGDIFSISLWSFSLCRFIELAFFFSPLAFRQQPSFLFTHIPSWGISLQAHSSTSNLWAEAPESVVAFTSLLWVSATNIPTLVGYLDFV